MYPIALHVHCLALIASVILLVRFDLGINAAGMEFPSLEVTWTVSTLVLLPLVHLCFIPNEVGYRGGGGGLASSDIFSTLYMQAQKGRLDRQSLISSAFERCRFVGFYRGIRSGNLFAE